MVSAAEGFAPGEFEELVRDALLHLYDSAYLQTHPLARLVEPSAGQSAILRGKLLLQALLDAIEALRPPSGTPSDSRAWRSYRLLELRYVEGLSAGETLDQLAVSKTQYQRDHAKALEAVASLLRDRWRVRQRGLGSAAAESRESLAASEAEQIAGQMSPEPVDLTTTLAGLIALFQSIEGENWAPFTLQAGPDIPPVYVDRVALRQVFLGLFSVALERGGSRAMEVSLALAGPNVEVRIQAQRSPHPGLLPDGEGALSPRPSPNACAKGKGEGGHHPRSISRSAGEGRPPSPANQSRMTEDEGPSPLPPRAEGVRQGGRGSGEFGSNPHTPPQTRSRIGEGWDEGSSYPSDPEIEVARRLVEALGGRLELEPPEAGTWRAQVTIPAAHRPVVLILDNHPDFINLVARYVAEHGWQVIGAQDVRQAERLVLETHPSVVLLDVMIPGQDGWDLLLAMKRRPETRGIPVIVCSVLYEPHVAKALGAVDYLAKPITQAALLEVLARWRPSYPGVYGPAPTC